MAFAVGMLIGPLWAGAVQQRYGWGTTVWTIGLLSGLTAIPAVSRVQGSPPKDGSNQNFLDFPFSLRNMICDPCGVGAD